MTDTSYPTAIYFVEKRPEHFTFIGHLVRLATFGVTLGLDAMLITGNVPDTAPPELHSPGLWVKYSDGHWEGVGDLYSNDQVLAS